MYENQIFIQNIPYDVDNQELGEWASTFGQVLTCSLKYDKAGRSRGFAFIKFATQEGHDNLRKNSFSSFMLLLIVEYCCCRRR
jgi:RNA recognition motif-containing protein